MAAVVAVVVGVGAVVGSSAVESGPVGALAPAVHVGGARAAGNSRLQPLLDELVDVGVPGVVAVVDTGARRWRLASGAARLDPRVAMRPAARFRAGSVTKTFIATVVLQLVGEGRLALDDTVERWLPGVVPNGDAMTVRQLLNHTTGIFNYTDDEAFFEAIVADPTRTFTPRELVAFATAHPPLFAPGEGWSYSNTGYILAGLIIREATGNTVVAELNRRILTPLRLYRTTFPVTSTTIPGYHARGYLPADNPFFPSPDGRPIDVTALNPSWAWTAGALVSTADDLARFFHALLGGRLLSPELLAEMKTTVEIDPTFHYGLGIYRQRQPCGTVWGHDGGVPGYVNVAWYSEDGRRSVNMMANIDLDFRTGPLFDLTARTAVCEMYGGVAADEESVVVSTLRVLAVDQLFTAR